jgi:hemolysin activation/secretion protein
VNAGEYPFYQSAFIGGNTTTRGFRAYRFSGHSSFYQNLEGRLVVSRLRSYVLSGLWGTFGFVDNGRVWANQEVSKQWHTGYGGGLWMRIYDLFMISGGVGFSEEGRYFRINGGFFF